MKAEYTSKQLCEMATSYAKHFSEQGIANPKFVNYDIQVSGVLTMLAERIEELEAQQWQPIETVPKDGTRVDLFDVRFGRKGKRAPDCYWHKKAKRWLTSCHDKEGWSFLRAPFNPTHWMSIPEAPQEHNDE